MPSSPPPERRPPPFAEFVGLVAALMAIGALAIDAMLPALPQMAQSLNIATAAQAQWIVISYLIGLGAGQLGCGPLADRYGRRPVLLIGIAIYMVFSLAAVFTTSLETMVFCRVVQGLGAAATRVMAVTIVRDRYSGDVMARVMSLAFIVLLTVPIIAPALGQGVVAIADWRWIFGGLALFGGGTFAWIALRLPETQHAEDRMSASFDQFIAAFRFAVTNRMAVGYMAAQTSMMASLFGFITVAQHVYVDIFKVGALFPVLFAIPAVFVAIASLMNAQVVGIFGSRRVSHVALLGFNVVTVVHLLLALSGWHNLWVFVAVLASMMACFGLAASNFGALAMEPMGHIAGTASAVQGFVTTLGGAALGGVIAQNVSGSVTPLLVGFAACGLGALAAVLVTERGRLLQAREPVAA